MQEPLTTGSEFSSLPTPSASQEPGWTVEPVDKNGNPVSNPNERWYDPKSGRHMQKGITQVLKYTIDESSLLRSPTASQGEGGALGEDVARSRGNTVGIRDQAMDIAKLNGHSVSRAEKNLLPTPNTMDMLPARDPSKIDKSKGGHANVRETVVNDMPRTNWGRFEPAIRRWEEVLGRPAPLPTKPDGKEGAHRLSSRFTEWMMGVPEGWITDVGLSRNEELKACGNGVVPQQAELALTLLLQGVELETDRSNE